METVLRITHAGFPQFSARGCQQILELLPILPIQRTINGDIVPLSSPNLQRYITTITCQDTLTPALHGLHRGMSVRIACIQKLVQLVSPAQNYLELLREPVPSTVHAFCEHGTLRADVEGRIVRLKSALDTPTYVSYCPELTMVVLQFSTKTYEWRPEVEWTLVASE
jgi:hypothetical protein